MLRSFPWIDTSSEADRRIDWASTESTYGEDQVNDRCMRRLDEAVNVMRQDVQVSEAYPKDSSTPRATSSRPSGPTMITLETP